MNKKKIIISVSVILGLAITFLTINYYKKTKTENEVSESTIDANTNIPTNTQNATVVKPKSGGFVKKIITPIKPNGASQSNAPKTIGAKAFAGKNGANAYTKAAANTQNIYKNYKADKYIGTFLALQNDFDKIAIEETGFFGNSNKIIFVPSKDLIY